MNIPASEVLVKFMEKLGVSCIFGIPGSPILPVYDALYDSPIRSVLAMRGASAMGRAWIWRQRPSSMSKKAWRSAPSC